MVVSYKAFERLNAASDFGITNGDRLMLSTPPASTMPASPAAMTRAADPTASSPEPHRRLIVAPGTSTGNPASSAAIRATLRLSSPAWFAQPSTTSPSSDQSTRGLRAISALIGSAARSSVRTPANAPP